MNNNVATSNYTNRKGNDNNKRFLNMDLIMNLVMIIKIVILSMSKTRQQW